MTLLDLCAVVALHGGYWSGPDGTALMGEGYVFFGMPGDGGLRALLGKSWAMSKYQLKVKYPTGSQGLGGHRRDGYEELRELVSGGVDAKPDNI